jgi:hypothetical protein
MSHLKFNISPEGLDWIDVSESSGYKRISFKEQLDHSYRQQLDAFYAEFLAGKTCEECTVSWSGKRSTLVPQNVYGASSSESIFRLCFGDNFVKRELDFNRLALAALVNVFEMPDWIKGFFIVKYPKSILQHEGTLVVRSVLEMSDKEVKLVLIVHPNHCLLVIKNQQQLVFYNYFDYQNEDDILYYLTFTLQQSGLLGKSGNAWLCNGVGDHDELIAKCITNAERITDLKSLSFECDPAFMVKSHKLCV